MSQLQLYLNACEHAINIPNNKQIMQIIHRWNAHDMYFKSYGDHEAKWTHLQAQFLTNATRINAGHINLDSVV